MRHHDGLAAPVQDLLLCANAVADEVIE